MTGLFSSAGPADSASPDSGPLADRMRPRSLDEVIGQDHIVGPGRLLHRAIQADRLSSVIFYGPPGTGKTSLARVIANTTRGSFESLNAVLSGVKDIREAIDRADERRRLYGKRTILFVDEVHRWNKAQQDALLPWVENGTLILVGATTENPFFEVNRALVSRSRIFQLKSLSSADLMETAKRTLADRERGYGRWNVRFEQGALEHLVEVSGGDARSLLNALELAVETSSWNAASGKSSIPGGTSDPGKGWPPPEGAEITISMEAAEESIQKRAVLYDRDGDYHFDTISAFIKSVRGSDPDAALYWLAKMVRAGEDPSFIFRRMIILASVDVGLADPHALEVVIACAEAFDRIGFPEGNFPLAHACLYLATAPKSNTTLSFFDALKEVDREDAGVPGHLRDASRDAEGFGHGEGYVYPHAYRDHWAAQQYLPAALRGKTFYTPSTIGYEGKIRDEVLRKREVQAAIIFGEYAEKDGQGNSGAALENPSDDGEILTWSASSKGREGWYKRLESGRGAVLLKDRDRIFNALNPLRHHRILIPQANDGLLLWEALRRVPEGLAAGIVDSQSAKNALAGFAAAVKLDEAEAPQIAVADPAGLPSPAQAEAWFGTSAFDGIAMREPWRRGFRGQSPAAVFAATAAGAAALLEKGKNRGSGGTFVLLVSPPGMGQRLSDLLENLPGETAGTRTVSRDLVEAFRAAEESFFARPEADDAPRPDGTGNSPANHRIWTPELPESALVSAGFAVSTETINQEEERLILAADIARWFDREKSVWGAAIAKVLGGADFAALKTLFLEAAGPLVWKWKSLLLTARRP
ncbi:MAG: AAA family ATPase [Treponema sp.]|jgi:putative ATPase|nr:AAA family ATPase [Treponema sp.]